MSRVDDITSVLTQLVSEDQDVGFRSGIVTAWDTQTGQNTVVIAGAPITNVPFLTRTEALSIRVGDVVGILRVKSQYFVLGRISVNPGEIEVRDADGDVRIRLGLDELRLIDTAGRELILSPEANNIDSELPPTPMMAFPDPLDFDEVTPAYFGNDSFGTLTMQARRIFGQDRTMRANNINLIDGGVQIGNGVYNIRALESFTGRVTLDMNARPPGVSSVYGIDIAGDSTDGTVRIGRLGSAGSASVDVIGDFTVSGGAKAFRIPHPTRPGHDLMHASTESPVSGVEYWGTGTIGDAGATVIELPDYFEGLTTANHRAVFVTARGGTVDWTDINHGEFTVTGDPGRSFSWLVKAERAGAGFDLEPPTRAIPEVETPDA